jgi:hypothetical protein
MTMVVRGVMVLAAAAALMMGCGQKAGDEDPGTGGDPGSTPPPPASNGLCNEISFGGGQVTDTLGTGQPTLGGGTMADGRYVLTRYEWYAPNQLHTRSITMEITGGGKYGQYLWQRDQEPEQRVTVNIATDADRIAMRGICPVGMDLEWDRFGMTDTGVTLFSTRDDKAAFFARQ